MLKRFYKPLFRQNINRFNTFQLVVCGHRLFENQTEIIWKPYSRLSAVL